MTDDACSPDRALRNPGMAIDSPATGPVCLHPDDTIKSSVNPAESIPFQRQCLNNKSPFISNSY
jgi:hypothetical protein